MVICMLFQTIQDGQQRQDIVIAILKKYTKVLRQLSAALVHKVLENVGYVVVTLVYRTELVDKVQWTHIAVDAVVKAELAAAAS